MIFNVCRTCGVRRGQRSRSITPAREQEAISQQNCAIPAAVSAQAKTWPSAHCSCRISSKPAIRNRFSSTGVAAAAAKRSSVLSSPPCSATSEMNSR